MGPLWPPSPQCISPPRGQGPKISFTRPPGSGMRAQCSRSRVPEFRFPGQTPTHPAPRAHAAKTPSAGRLVIRVRAFRLNGSLKRLGFRLGRRHPLETFQTPLAPNSPVSLSVLAKGLRTEKSAKSKPTVVVGFGSGNQAGKGREWFSYPSGNHVCKYAALFLVRPNGLGLLFRFGRQLCRRSLHLHAFKG